MTDHSDGWKLFCSLCAATTSTNEINELFDLFLTPAEREDIASRLVIIREIISGKRTHREIAEKFNISIAKVSRGSNAIKALHTKAKTSRITQQLLNL